MCNLACASVCTFWTQQQHACGCVGYHRDFNICKQLKRSLRRKYPRVDPHQETRPGHTWGFDLLEWKTVSINGNKYTVVMRDYATGKFVVKHMRNKSDLTDTMQSIITELRADPRFKLPDDAGYELVSLLKCDCAGEQRDDNAEWNEMLKRNRVRNEWGDPTDKRSTGFQESAGPCKDNRTWCKSNYEPDCVSCFMVGVLR